VEESDGCGLICQRHLLLTRVSIKETACRAIFSGSLLGGTRELKGRSISLFDHYFRRFVIAGKEFVADTRARETDSDDAARDFFASLNGKYGALLLTLSTISFAAPQPCSSSCTTPIKI
jgi:hypothetical protein